MIAERRWWMGFTYWRTKHHVWFYFKLCHIKVAWRRLRWWARGNGERAQMDLGPWWCYHDNILGENVAFSSELNLHLVIWNSGFSVCMDSPILLVLTTPPISFSIACGNRYLEHLNGLATILCPLRHGYSLIVFHFIQVPSHSCFFIFLWSLYNKLEEKESKLAFRIENDRWVQNTQSGLEKKLEYHHIYDI